MVNAFIKDEIKALAAQGYPVHLMADKLDADETALEKFYIDCFAEDSSAFPLRLLATSEWLQKNCSQNLFFKSVPNCKQVHLPLKG